ncbi:MAG: MaoC/PaaZ C-terminal domain-containing protein [Isosphaeraceae bacterium]
MPRREMTTLVFDDLVVGDEWESPRRTITEADVVNFAGISGDFNPLHMDQEFARQNAFRTPVAHGLLGLSVASGLSSHAPRVDTLALLAILEWKFLQPIKFGDTLGVITRVEALERKAHGRRGVVTWHRKIVNQEGCIIQEGVTQTLVGNRKDPDPLNLTEVPDEGKPAIS